MNFLQLNKFTELHDGKRIFFCKTDFIVSDFDTISNLDNDIILITGNSDYPITDQHLKILPKNVKKWYGQNILSNNNIVEPIPLGIENKIESFRNGHGIGYLERVTEKEILLNRKLNIKPKRKIYSNFQINTNYSHRNEVKQKCLISKFIDWEEPHLSLREFFDKILDYEMVVCPAGNGVDTHRLWEVLYSDRIPITIKTGNFKIYEMYKMFPIIILNSINELNDGELINEKYNEIKRKHFDKKMLDCEFWKNKIISSK